MDDSDENISRMQKEDFERCNSIEIIHDTSANSGQDSVEIPNMRPEQPKRKKNLKILPRVKKGVKKFTMQEGSKGVKKLTMQEGSSDGKILPRVKKGVKKLTMQKAKDRRV